MQLDDYKILKEKILGEQKPQKISFTQGHSHADDDSGGQSTL